MIINKVMKKNLNFTLTGFILISCVQLTWTIQCYVGDGATNPQYPTDCKKSEIACRVKFLIKENNNSS